MLVELSWTEISNMPATSDSQDPPHLLVIEDVSLEDPFMYVECPFETVKIGQSYEHVAHRRPAFGGRMVHIPDPGGFWAGGSGRSVWWADVHAERHYCTTAYSFESSDPIPVITFVSRWNGRWGTGEKCAVIDLGVRAHATGTCYYRGLCEEAGIFEALGVEDPMRWDRWPTELPSREGRYPVYYWSDGSGEDFCAGLTLEAP